MCLKGYIGIKHCSDAPTSGRFVNELSGLSTELINAVANEEQLNFSGLFEQVEDRAIGRLKHDFARFARENKFKISDHLFKSKKINPDLTREYQTTEMTGVYVEIPNSELIRIKVKNLVIFPKVSETITIQTIDLIDQSELNSQEVNVVGGKLNTIELEEFTITPQYANQKIFIGAEISSNLYEAENTFFLLDYANCACNDEDNVLRIQTAKIGINDSKLRENILFINPGVSFWVDMDIYCDLEELICRNLKSVEQAYLYLLGVELLDEKLMSYQTNFFTYGNEERTQMKQEQYEAKYIDALKLAIENINFEDPCLDCRDVAPYESGAYMP